MKSAIYYIFIFIDNRNIREQHLWNDGIHLQNQGKVILSNNFANSINNYNYFLDRRRFTQRVT